MHGLSKKWSNILFRLWRLSIIQEYFKMNRNYESIPLDLLVLSSDISHPFLDASSGRLIICRQIYSFSNTWMVFSVDSKLLSELYFVEINQHNQMFIYRDTIQYVISKWKREKWLYHCNHLWLMIFDLELLNKCYVLFFSKYNIIVMLIAILFLGLISRRKTDCKILKIASPLSLCIIHNCRHLSKP